MKPSTAFQRFSLHTQRSPFNPCDCRACQLVHNYQLARARIYKRHAPSLGDFRIHPHPNGKWVSLVFVLAFDIPRDRARVLVWNSKQQWQNPSWVRYSTLRALGTKDSLKEAEQVRIAWDTITLPVYVNTANTPRGRSS